MPYQRPNLSTLRQQVAADITSAITGADGLLRVGNLPILGTVLAGLSNLHYGFLDWISKQAVPFTSTDEYLEGWAGLIGVFREAATSSSGTVTFTGVNGTIIPTGSALVRSDQRAYITTAQGTISGGTVTVPAKDVSTGAAGNMDAGTVMTLGVAIAGIQSNGVAASDFTGGADVETNDSLRSRMLQRFQNPPQGGSEQDYVTWSREVAGVSRAWCLRNGMGTGTVVVYFMMDVSEAAHSGFPQGSNGVATLEPRDTPATGDQLALANYIYPLQPVTALVYAVAPTAAPQAFTIKGLTPDTSDNRSAIVAAIADVFLREGDARGTVPVPHEDVVSAITAIPGITDFIITSPLTDIITTTGQLPTVGTITYI